MSFLMIAFRFVAMHTTPHTNRNAPRIRNGVKPIWPADVTNPGSAQVAAPTTSVTYQGPALIRGHTYYWVVIGQDKTQNNAISAFTISPIQFDTPVEAALTADVIAAITARVPD